MTENDKEGVSLTIPDDIGAHVEGSKLVIGDEEYSLTRLKQEIEKRADEKAPWTVGLGSSGIVIGAAAAGPPGGVAGGVIGTGVGYLKDRGYIGSDEEVEVEEIDLESVEEAESDTPDRDVSIEELPEIFKKYEDKWYRPDSGIYLLTVRTPEGDRAYYETVEGARSRLEREYE